MTNRLLQADCEKNCFTLKNVFAGYGKDDVIKNISLKFEKGKLTSIIGPNGSGKSTLIKAALGIIETHGGTINIDSADAKNMSSKQIAKKAAYLPQERTDVQMNVSDLVLQGRFPHLGFMKNYSQKDYDAVQKALLQTGISHFSQSPLCTLSGGMKQKAYIAMALAQDTDYIFLDEPTTYLDITNQIETMKTLHVLSRCGKGVISVMHDLALCFSFSDYVAIIGSGELVDYDTPHNLCKKDTAKKVFGISLCHDSEKNSFYYVYDGK